MRYITNSHSCPLSFPHRGIRSRFLILPPFSGVVRVVQDVVLGGERLNVEQYVPRNHLEERGRGRSRFYHVMSYEINTACALLDALVVAQKCLRVNTQIHPTSTGPFWNLVEMSYRDHSDWVIILFLLVVAIWEGGLTAEI